VRGLSSAVLEGIRLSIGEIIVVMDADLSHPPEKIPELIEKIKEKEADFVIGSRFIKGGSASHFNLYRKANAYFSKILAYPLVKVNDPLAGFFAFPRNLLRDNIDLNPIGFKIGLEIMVKANPEKIVEIPISFQERLYGESKLNLKEQLNYLLHLKRLYEDKYQSLSEFIKFSVVGGSGVIVDLTSLYIAYGLINIPYRISRVISFLIALSSNFILNRSFTFLKCRKENIVRRYILFLIVCIFGFFINWIISVYLFENTLFFRKHYLLSAFLGVLGGLLINFTGSKFLVFR
jgi:dolichol-phosphate mannosyltransferase